MDEARDVKAFFIETRGLTIAKAEGSHPGIVKVLPTGNICVVRCDSATYNYLEGQELTLKGVVPSKLDHFAGFSGGTGDAEACNGQTECTITIGAGDSSIEALFEGNEEVALSLQKQGGGQATITANGNYPGLRCLNTCSSASGTFYSEPSAEVATVSWTLNAGTSSIEWTTAAGTCTGSSEEVEGSCEVTMDEAHELVAKLE